MTALRRKKNKCLISHSHKELFQKVFPPNKQWHLEIHVLWKSSTSWPFLSSCHEAHWKSVLTRDCGLRKRGSQNVTGHTNPFSVGPAMYWRAIYSLEALLKNMGSHKLLGHTESLADVKYRTVKTVINPRVFSTASRCTQRYKLSLLSFNAYIPIFSQRGLFQQTEHLHDTTDHVILLFSIQSEKKTRFVADLPPQAVLYQTGLEP